MIDELDQLVGGWIRTGLVYLAAGLWVLVRLPWPLRLHGVLVAAHGTQGLHLGRRLASGHNDPSQRRALARTLAADAVVLAVLVALTVVFRP